jgi:hypothetical protein
LAVVCNGPSKLRVYRFNNLSAPVELGTGAGVVAYLFPYSAVWSPDGGYVAVICQGNDRLRVYRCNYYYTGQPSANQSFSNGLLFGDKAKGFNFDANVQVLSGAVVKVKGKIKDDSV